MTSAPASRTRVLAVLFVALCTSSDIAIAQDRTTRNNPGGLTSIPQRDSRPDSIVIYNDTNESVTITLIDYVCGERRSKTTIAPGRRAGLRMCYDPQRKDFRFSYAVEGRGHFSDYGIYGRVGQGFQVALRSARPGATMRRTTPAARRDVLARRERSSDRDQGDSRTSGNSGSGNRNRSGVILGLGESCRLGRMAQIENFSSDRYRVVVERNWKQGNEEGITRSTYTVRPGATVNVGCTWEETRPYTTTNTYNIVSRTRL